MVDVYGVLLSGNSFCQLASIILPLRTMALMSAASASVTHVRLVAVDHGTCLAARAAVRRLEIDLLPRLGFPVPGERSVVLLIELARRVVRDVEERDGVRGARGARQQDHRGSHADESAFEHVNL